MPAQWALWSRWSRARRKRSRSPPGAATARKACAVSPSACPMMTTAAADVVQKLREANERTLVIALIETAAGIANAEAIMAVAGVDLGWLGHFDLTTSMGIPGQLDHPDFLAAVDR